MRVVDVPVQAWGWLSLAAGLAVLDSVAPLIAVPPAETGLKWPNDVLARGGKLAGILAEVAQPFVVLGVGLNVTQAPKRLIPTRPHCWTSEWRHRTATA
ncbi:bifunctional biotin operon repressor/biotin--[acetyl-CoA-carboxylase] synthetase [Mycobacterium tuberculosis]|nr:bifunctional biotin operon repressor/biotin--[acetyl-CoA-carboxylase] synthetase [Mycobacterium tuberculosis]